MMTYSCNLARTGMLDARKVEPIENTMLVKPNGGLWVSRPDHPGWEDWCKKEQPDWLSNENAKVTMNPDARVLVIDSKDSYQNALNQFPYQDTPLGRTLDYERIAKSYDVIEFRMDDYPGLYHEMYGLDCDSVLILNVDAIQCFENPKEITMYEETMEFGPSLDSLDTIEDDERDHDMEPETQHELTDAEILDANDQILDEPKLNVPVKYSKLGIPEGYESTEYFTSIKEADEFITNLGSDYEGYIEHPDRDTYTEEYCDQFEKALEDYYESKANEQELAGASLDSLDTIEDDELDYEQLEYEAEVSERELADMELDENDEIGFDPAD